MFFAKDASCKPLKLQKFSKNDKESQAVIIENLHDHGHVYRVHVLVVLRVLAPDASTCWYHGKGVETIVLLVHCYMISCTMQRYRVPSTDILHQNQN